MDPDSERTSSLLMTGTISSRRPQSRVPGSRRDIVASIDEIDALGTLSLRPSVHNASSVKQASESSADDMTVVAHSGRSNAAPSSSTSTFYEERAVESDNPKSNVAAADEASVQSRSDVNPGQALVHGSSANNTNPRRVDPQPRLGFQWLFAAAVLIAAAWYVLLQPAPQHLERQWVSGRAR